TCSLPKLRRQFKAGSQPAFFISDSWRRRTVRGVMQTSRSIPLSGSLAIGSVVAQSVPAGVKVADGHREPASRLFAEDHFDRRPKRGGIGGLPAVEGVGGEVC